jgi:hypothetical protein
METIAIRLLTRANNSCSNHTSTAKETDFEELFKGLKMYARDTRTYWGMMATLIAELFGMKSVRDEQFIDAVRWLLSNGARHLSILPMRFLVTRMPQLAKELPL